MEAGEPFGGQTCVGDTLVPLRRCRPCRQRRPRPARVPGPARPRQAAYTGSGNDSTYISRVEASRNSSLDSRIEKTNSRVIIENQEPADSDGSTGKPCGFSNTLV